MLYSGEKAGNAALVISAANDFEGSVMNNMNGTWSIGMNGEIESVPAGYAHKTVFVLGDGATNAIDKYGQLMRKAYYTEKMLDPKVELTVNWLGYWTDVSPD